MKILLNVLPEEKKESLVRKFRYRFFIWQTTLVFLLELYYIAILGGIFTILTYQTKVNNDTLVVFEQVNEEAKKLASYQEEFKRINAEAESVARYQRSHLHWSALLALLQKLTPDGVILVELLTKDYTVSLSGQAKTRDQFLRFEAALKGDECVSDVRVPISNLFSQVAVNFQIDFNLKKDCLTNP
ncbi:MAG: PilN domain-containing protein [Candidatus Moraniibacteriota bacterium]